MKRYGEFSIKFLLVASGALTLILSGCSPGEAEDAAHSSTASVTPATQTPAEVTIDASTATTAPVLPPPGSSGMVTPATVQPSAIEIGQAECPVNAEGNPMSDLEFLNHLVGQLNESRVAPTETPQKAFKTEAEQMAYEEAMQKAKEPVRDLNELVTAGILKTLPQAPNGQQYTIDAQSGKVVLQ